MRLVTRGFPRVRHVDDRGAIRRAHMADIGEIALGDDLPAAGNI
jgi:hypothetical protein